MTDMKILDESHLNDVCKIGQGEVTCRYILCGSEGFFCGKNSSLAKTVDHRVEAGKMNAKGDNCPGFPYD